MATVADIQAYIRTNKVPKDVGMRMLSKAEDLDEPKQQEYQTAPLDATEKDPGFTDTFLPTVLAKKGRDITQKALTQEGRDGLMSQAKDSIVQNLKDLPLQPYKGMIDGSTNLISELGREIGGASGGSKNAPGALLGNLLNFAIPYAPKGLKAVDASLGGHLGGMLKGAGEGAMNAQPRGLLSAPIHGAIKGLVNGMNKLEPLSNPVDKLASGSDMLSQANASPDAIETMLGKLEPNPEPISNPTGRDPRPLTPKMNLSKAQNPTGPIAGVRKGVSMNDMLKNIPEKAPDIQPSKTAPQEIENTIQSIKAPEFDNPAQRALDMARRRLKVASDPKEIQDLNGRIDKLKGMVDRLNSHKEMEIF